MSIVRLENLGRAGILFDLPDYSLPPEAYSYGKNVRFGNEVVCKTAGDSQVYGNLDANAGPFFLVPWADVITYSWLYGSGSRVFRHTGSAETNVTRYTTTPGDDDYSGGSDPTWSSAIFNGLPVLNVDSFSDPPQSWNTVTNRFQNLPGWPSSTYCKLISSFGNYLIAADLQESGNRYYYKIRWSSAAPVGALPSTWTPAASNSAGSNPRLGETSDFILDMLSLKNIHCIYKEDHVWGMRWVGGNYVFDVQPIFRNFGILAKGCVGEFSEGRSDKRLPKHFVVTKGDVIVHDTNMWQSIANKKTKDNIFEVMDQDNSHHSFVVHNERMKEMMFFYPETGNTYCNMCAVWNYEDNSWGYRDADQMRCGALGVDTSATAPRVIDDINETIDSQNYKFDGRTYNPNEKQVLIGSPTNNELYRVDLTNQFHGNAINSVLERTGLPIAGNDRFGNPKIDANSTKFFRGIRHYWIVTGKLVSQVDSI